MRDYDVRCEKNIMLKQNKTKGDSYETFIIIIEQEIILLRGVFHLLHLRIRMVEERTPMNPHIFFR